MRWNENVRLRTVVSFLILGAFFAITVWGIQAVKSGKKISGAPAPLYRGYVLNQKVWQILQSARRASRAGDKNLTGIPPRVNGGIGLRSEIDPARYSIKVESPQKNLLLPIEAFRLLPKTQSETEFRCIEGWSEDITYAGAKFSDFMRIYDLGKKSDGTYYAYVGLETPDGEYYVSIDMESMLHDQTLLTYEMNGAPISLINGAPLRLLIPIKYGIKSLKRIGKISFSDTRPPDYWAERGYDWYSGL